MNDMLYIEAQTITCEWKDELLLIRSYILCKGHLLSSSSQINKSLVD